MNKRDRKNIDLLLRIAEGLPLSADARVAASIVIGNEVIAIGVNEEKTHPMAKRFSKNKDAIYLHAEVAAIKNALRKVSVNDLARATIYIARAKKTGRGGSFKEGEAAPCQGCRRAIETFGIRRVVHTSESVAARDEAPEKKEDQGQPRERVSHA